VNAGSLINDMLRQYGIPPAVAIDRAVAKSKHDRAPKSVQRLLKDVEAIARETTMPRGEVQIVSGRTGYGKSYFLQRQVAYLVQQGYQVQFTQTIEDPGTIKAIRDGEVREFSIVEPKLMFKPPMRRDYWAEAFASMYRHHSGPVDPDLEEGLKV
jgi:hypothetical protein